LESGAAVNKIARGLGAERKTRVSAAGGYFSAMQLLADIEARFRVPLSSASWTLIRASV
jgi:hypothetical protein